MSEEDLIAERRKKLDNIRASGINPYPYTYKQTHHSKDIHEKHKGLQKEEHSSEEVSIAGRIMTVRKMGKAAFFDLQDSSGKIQIYIREDSVPEEDFNLFQNLDLGDIVGVKGNVFRTKMGELSIKCKKLTILTKSLRPLPDKFHGLKDMEIRYRRRYLDLITNPEIKDVFIKRAQIIREIRNFLDEKGFLEVEIPNLQTQYGGASARPFKTHINAWDMDLFLSISPEPHLKRLIVGGFEKVYTICKNFRNEGADKTHNPEFTMLEFYQSYIDYDEGMSIIEKMVESVAMSVLGTTKITFRGETADVKAPWTRITMKDAIKQYAQIDVNSLDDEGLKNIMRNHNIEYEGDFNKGMAIMKIFEELAEDKIRGPVHLIEHPIESTPLCKSLRTGDNKFIERFESYLFGVELTNGYSELNDPILQRSLLQEQSDARLMGEETYPMDEDFVQSIEYGMTPTGGVGLGVDRLVIFLTNSDTIRDVILFPTMKPEQETKEDNN